MLLDYTTDFMEKQSDKMLERKYAKLYKISDKFLDPKKYIRINPYSNCYICKKPQRIYNLANALYKGGYDVSVKPICSKRIYEIYYEFATVFIFWGVPVEHFDMLKSKSTLSLRNQAIIIYRDIYDPMKYSDIADNLKLIVVKQPQIVENPVANANVFPPIEFDEEVYIGEFALNIMRRERKPLEFAYEIISADVDATLVKIAILYDCTVETQHIPMFNDIMLTRTRVSVNANDIYYIYNSASYELIPFSTIDNFRIASIYVCARFVCIDIFYLKFLVLRGKLSNVQDRIEKLQMLHYRLSIQTDVTFNHVKLDVKKISLYYYGQYIEPRIVYAENCVAERMYSPSELIAAGKSLVYL